MTIEEAETLALGTLKQVMEEKLNSDNVEIGAVTTKTRQFKVYQKEELERIINRL